MPRAASWSGTPSIRGSSETVRMMLLTFSLVGLQFTWGIEMTYCTPYLLQLGLTKSHTSAVWIAGPLSGLIMQPLVGVLSDDSKSKWGRRRPFMVGGSFLVAACLLCLGWAKEIVSALVADEAARRTWTVVLAITSIYATDFSINVVQSCCRSLIIDTLPIPKQQLGSAWASRMAAIGHMIVYAVGTLDLRSILGDTLGDSQFKQLCVIAGLALIFCQSLTSYCVTERILVSSTDPDKSGPLESIIKIFRTTHDLPPRIRAICNVQFWAWIGWFPFMFYSPTWVGETYFRYNAPSPPSDSTGSPAISDPLGDLGRIASLSLVIFSSISLLSSIALPWAIRSPDQLLPPHTPTTPRRFTPRPWPRPLRPIRLLAAPAVRALKTPLLLLAQSLRLHGRCRPDLLSAWQASHLLFAAAMLAAPLVRGVRGATLVVGACGLPWALAGWAPFAFLGVEINRLAAASANGNGNGNGDGTGTVNRGGGARGGHARGHSLSLSGGGVGGPGPFGRTSVDGEWERERERGNVLRLSHGPGATGYGAGDSDGEDEEDEGWDLENGSLLRVGKARGDEGVSSSTGETAGIYLGILNLYTTLPQFVGTFISMVVFAIFEPGRKETEGGSADEEMGEEVKGVNGIAVCMFIGGCCSLVAAWATARMKATTRGS